MGLSEFIKTNNIKGAIFDMDGTLTDSMGRWSEIYAMLIDYLKIELPQGFAIELLNECKPFNLKNRYTWRSVETRRATWRRRTKKS